MKDIYKDIFQFVSLTETKVRIMKCCSLRVPPKRLYLLLDCTIRKTEDKSKNT